VEQQPYTALPAELLDACSGFTAANWSECLVPHVQQQRCTSQSLLQLLQQVLPLASAAQLAHFVIFEALALLTRQLCSSSSSNSSSGASSTSSSSSSSTSSAMCILKLCRAAALQPGSRLQAVSSTAELRNTILALKLRDAGASIGAEAESVLMEACVAAMAAAV
jgi:hypothetical protein